MRSAQRVCGSVKPRSTSYRSKPHALRWVHHLRPRGPAVVERRQRQLGAHAGAQEWTLRWIHGWDAPTFTRLAESASKAVGRVRTQTAEVVARLLQPDRLLRPGLSTLSQS